MDMQKTGLLICDARKAKGYTQKELADKLCVTDKAVSKWERGLSFPDVSMLSSISSTLDIPIETLITGDAGDAGQSVDVVKDTLELSNKEIKRKTVKHKKILIGVVACALAIIIALGVCFGIAFTPADGFSSTKKDVLVVETITGGAPYELSVRGRMATYPPTYAQVQNDAIAFDLFKQVKEEVASKGDSCQQIAPYAQAISQLLITRDNQDGTKDYFVFEERHTNAKRTYALNSLETALHKKVGVEMVEYVTIFPWYCLAGEDDAYGVSLLDSIEYQLKRFGAKSAQEVVLDFYQQSGRFEVVESGNKIVVTPNFQLDESKAYLQNRKTVAFEITFEHKPTVDIDVMSVKILD